MALTALQTTDVTQVLVGLLETVENLRVYPYVADNVRVPAAVISQPDIDYVDQDAAFCSATWVFPVHLVTSRANDKKAQQDMSALILEVVTSLKADVPGIFSIEPLNARPITVTVNGQDLLAICFRSGSEPERRRERCPSTPSRL